MWLLMKKMPVKTAVFAIACLMVLAAGWRMREVRLYGPMRNDEAFTYVAYVKRGDYFDYSRPNNHVLNTLLMAGSAKVLGESPLGLRMPAFVCGLLLMPAVGLLCFQLSGSGAMALAAMALAAGSPALVEYSANARGYSLVALAAVLMGCLTVRLRRAPGWKMGWVGWVICGVAGLYAVPIMVYAIAPLALLLLADPCTEARKRVAPLGVAMVAMGIATAALYAPVVAKSGLAAITTNPFVTPMGLGTVPGEMAARFAEMATTWTGSGSGLFVAFLCVGTVASVFTVEKRGGNRMQLLALAGIAVLLAAGFLQRRVPPVRVCLYLQAWMIACACAAMGQLAATEWVRIAMAAALMLLAGYDGYRVKKQPLLISEDPHTFVDAGEVAAHLVQGGLYRGDTALIWNSSENLWPPLLYYLIQMQPEQGETVDWNDPASRRIFVLIERTDKIEDFLRSRPGFSELYEAPQLVEVTRNSCVYLARRR